MGILELLEKDNLLEIIEKLNINGSGFYKSTFDEVRYLINSKESFNLDKRKTLICKASLVIALKYYIGQINGINRNKIKVESLIKLDSLDIKGVIRYIDEKNNNIIFYTILEGIAEDSEFIWYNNSVLEIRKDLGYNLENYIDYMQGIFYAEADSYGFKLYL